KARSDFKGAEVERTEERLFIPNRSNPYILSKNKSLFRILTQMRDEAHRFSRKLHHKAEKKRTITSWLDQVEGIGPKRRSKILSELELTQAELSQLTPEEIMKELDVSKKIAENVLKVIKS
ncbi:MAG: helix-hairpin-helix domain-containing protein, partial [Halobacteriovoraceae bacterium]|nr:helix-hairpin-helix domain-containing protein [Halobacteriovoraceae bacterium]